MGVMDCVGGRHGYTTRTVAALGNTRILGDIDEEDASQEEEAVRTSEGLHNLCGTPTTSLFMACTAFEEDDDDEEV